MCHKLRGRWVHVFALIRVEVSGFGCVPVIAVVGYEPVEAIFVLHHPAAFHPKAKFLTYWTYSVSPCLKKCFHLAFVDRIHAKLHFSCHVGSPMHSGRFRPILLEATFAPQLLVRL